MYTGSRIKSLGNSYDLGCRDGGGGHGGDAVNGHDDPSFTRLAQPHKPPFHSGKGAADDAYPLPFCQFGLLGREVDHPGFEVSGHGDEVLHLRLGNGHRTAHAVHDVHYVAQDRQTIGFQVIDNRLGGFDEEVIVNRGFTRAADAALTVATADEAFGHEGFDAPMFERGAGLKFPLIGNAEHVPRDLLSILHRLFLAFADPEAGAASGTGILWGRRNSFNSKNTN